MSKRPGGLTALAVFNFVFGGIGLLSALASIAVVSTIKTAMEQQGIDVSLPFIYISLGVAAIVATLEIISGVGYLKMSRVMGRIMGTIFALASFVHVIVQIKLWDGNAGFNIIYEFSYPLITLFLLHVTFRNDLTN